MGSPLPESTIKHCIYSKTHLSQLPPDYLVASADHNISKHVLFERLQSSDNSQIVNTNARDMIELCKACALVPVNDSRVNGNSLEGNLTWAENVSRSLYNHTQECMLQVPDYPR